MPKTQYFQIINEIALFVVSKNGQWKLYMIFCPSSIMVREKACIFHFSVNLSFLPFVSILQMTVVELSPINQSVSWSVSQSLNQ
jgi:hypothetical protein